MINHLVNRNAHTDNHNKIGESDYMQKILLKIPCIFVIEY